MVDVTMKDTVAPWTSQPITVKPDGVMLEWKGVNDSPATTSTSTTAVFPNQILRKLESKGLEVLEGTRA